MNHTSGDRLGLADGVLVLVGTAFLLIALVSAGAAEVPARVPGSFAAPAGPVVPTVAGTARALESALPEGASIDPNTLELVGLDVQAEDGSTVVGWNTLRRYQYQEGLAGLPADIRALDGERVTMVGFLLPLYEFEDIREFHLVASHWSCCFGVPPGLSGWVSVLLRPGEKGLGNTIEPIRVTGTFRVDEHKEAGYLVSIYALDDAKATVLTW